MALTNFEIDEKTRLQYKAWCALNRTDMSKHLREFIELTVELQRNPLELLKAHVKTNGITNPKNKKQ